LGIYLRPAVLEEALEFLAPGHAPPGLVVVAGGTDHFPARVGRPPAPAILDITAIPELCGVTALDDHWRIGAATRWSAITRDEGLPPLFDGLRQAGREIGGVQIQNVGTLAGNLCNASPAADGIPVLLAMDARVELRDRDGATTMAVAEFLRGRNRTALVPGQLVTAILVPKPTAPATVSAFRKLGARRYQVISIAMLCAVLHLEGRTIRGAGIAVGACSPLARRLPGLEGRLRGRALEPGLGELLQEEDLAELAPIDDVRADAAYRREAVPVLLRRLLDGLARDDLG